MAIDELIEKLRAAASAEATSPYRRGYLDALADLEWAIAVQAEHSKDIEEKA